MLRDLTKHTHASFEAARQLRSGKYSDLEVYAVRRMATSLEEPGRSRATRLINQALSSRNLTPPKSNLSLTIPFLAHSNFQADAQRWLATILNQHKHFAIPLHLPIRVVYEKQHILLYAVVSKSTVDGKTKLGNLPSRPAPVWLQSPSRPPLARPYLLSR